MKTSRVRWFSGAIVGVLMILLIGNLAYINRSNDSIERSLYETRNRLYDLEARDIILSRIVEVDEEIIEVNTRGLQLCGEGVIDSEEFDHLEGRLQMLWQRRNDLLRDLPGEKPGAVNAVLQ